MQALVLAGGEGTRLRPLTLTVPKPVMPLAGKPFLHFMLTWLRGHGVDRAILSCGFMADAVAEVLGHEHAGIELQYVNEQEPLGTAGPLRLAADQGLLEDRLLVLNGDVLTDIDLTAQIAQHERTGAKATLALIAVDDTSSYGVVPTAPDGRVEAFLEKSTEPVPTNRINAGAYVLEREVVDRIPAGRAVSFEREIFPELVGAGLYGHEVAGYWVDIGTPERYLEATHDLLAGRVGSDLAARDESGSLIYEGCITSGARIGPQAVIERHCSVGAGSHVERSVVGEGTLIGPDCLVQEAILADGVRLGEGARVEKLAVIGSRAVIGEGAVIEAGARLAPEARVEPRARVAEGTPA
jgi:mannose-1-phosphate guanylyltransferase